MSSHAALPEIRHVTRSPTRNVADVSFSSVGDSYAESSSAASARSSGDKKRRTSALGDKAHPDRQPSKETREPSREEDGPIFHGHKGRMMKSGGFLLESVFTNASPRGHEGATPRGQGKKSEKANGTIHVEKRSLGSARLSGESSPRHSSPLSRHIQIDGANDDDTTDSRPASRATSIDPAQLVQMALSLSEGRKRQVSNPLQAPPSPNGSRVASGKASPLGAAKATPTRAAQRMSRLVDDSPHHMPTSLASSQEVGNRSESPIDVDNVLYTFSPATLSRAEKARRYFELASEHRRLLEHLPPLKPDATAPGDSSDGHEGNHDKDRQELERVGTYFRGRYQLGRPYNPLQSLRDRRVRNKERKQTTCPADGFQDTTCIKAWIDDVADASKDPEFRPGEDQVSLPGFFKGQRGDNGFSAPENGNGHRRTDTVSSVVTKPENGWTIEPAELLANTYWVEKNDNKTLIEDRHGRRIFPPRRRPSIDQGRHSIDSASQWNDTYMDRQSEQNDSEHEDKPKHRHRNILHIPDRLRRNKEPRIMRSDSVSSSSSIEGRNPPALQFHSIKGGDENTGPLERHMREMIAQDEAGELSSPELRSPDHWDSKHTQHPVTRESIDGQRPGTSHHHANGRLSVDLRHHRRARSADGRIDKGHTPSSSIDTLESPSSSIGGYKISTMDFSPQTHAKGEHKGLARRLPLMRSRSKDRNHVEQTDFAAQFGTSLSPVHSADNSEVSQGRASLDVPRTTDARRYLTSDSMSSSNLKRMNTGSTAAGSSATHSTGRRFFKSGRIGELMRNESSRFGDRFRNRDRSGEISDLSRTASDMSDVDDDSPKNRILAGVDSRAEDSDVSPRSSLDRGRSKGKYFMSNLPSFISPAAKDKRAAVLQMDGDPISRQQRARKEAGRSPRFNRLAPPRINLPDDDNASNADTRSYLDPRDETSRLGSAVSRSVRSDSTSRDPLRLTESYLLRRNGKSAMAGFDGKRQWSISDQSRPEKREEKVTHRDVERVNALLLASGIKAHEILQQGLVVPDNPSRFLAAAFRTAGTELQRVPRKAEHLIAAQVFSSTLSTTLTDFNSSVHHFEADTAKTLSAQLDDLRRRAGDQLTQLVHETSDEADAFNVELTTRPTQAIQRVDDAIEELYRRRRRQFRLLRRAGFKALEWMLLGIMWGVWFVVVVVQTAKKFVLALLVFIRWLLWF